MKKVLCLRNLVVLLMILFIIVSCNPNENNAIDDIQQTAALRNVTFSYKNTEMTIGLPEGALDGASFAELLLTDSSRFADPSNYSIGFISTLEADNTNSNAADAKFDGLIVDIVMDTIYSTPIEAIAGPFDISKNTIDSVHATGTLNLATHRLAGLYIFRQVVDGNDLATTLSPDLLYKNGALEGEIEVPDMHKNIPTRASDEMKAFLSGLLNSGILDP